MKKFEIEIKWTIIYSLVYIIWMYIEKLLGWHNESILYQPVYNLLFTPVSVFLFTLALIDKKRNYYKNEIDWKQGSISGIILSVLITVLNPAVLYITHNFISPDFFDNAINASISDTFTLEKAKAHFNINTAISNSVFEKLSFGVVISATISYFIRTKKN
ncbi:DUF4199 domain-containing protein [Flavobacterium sediminilitoris]|uniref:DUF4199 domain-containing protein n=1 Tax=Flavobacterium sediminilitoris TaxID=2024526 RepID=A0ABY4HMD6_9FLAO|nr:MULTISPECIES: DUF4199 domain-containing protein [Flavobacterium]UOX33451.1 DUF4199 domain-containing protein [Flavobacterium sediminilitoris]